MGISEDTFALDPVPLAGTVRSASKTCASHSEFLLIVKKYESKKDYLRTSWDDENDFSHWDCWFTSTAQGGGRNLITSGRQLVAPPTWDLSGWTKMTSLSPVSKAGLKDNIWGPVDGVELEFCGCSFTPDFPPVCPAPGGGGRRDLTTLSYPDSIWSDVPSSPRITMTTSVSSRTEGKRV